MLTINTQSAFARPSVLIGIMLVLITLAIVFINSKGTKPISNDTSDNRVETIKTNTLFKVTTSTDTEQIASINPSFQINTIATYHISPDEGTTHDLTIARYIDDQGFDKSAIIYLPEQKTSGEKVTEVKTDSITLSGNKSSQFRYEKWLTISEAIKKFTNEESLFISFWDNAQRIHLFTGREIWINGPDKNAYNSKQEQALWGSIAGSFDAEGNLLKYSQYLLQDMDTAINELQKELPENRDVYIVMSSDDLAHVEEIAILTGQGLPLETRLFPTDTDLHNSISKVKEWAKEGHGTGSYLVQPVSEKFNRVWRITDKSFENSLFVRLLPFTSSLDRPLHNTKLVYQSDWGAYLSIYQLIN